MARTLPVGLVPQLQGILDAELARGNEMVEVTNWPPICSLLIILRRPFSANYLPLPDVEFASINDRHYWKDEYRFKGGTQTVACGFG
jgi:hypothetical protein